LMQMGYPPKGDPTFGDTWGLLKGNLIPRGGMAAQILFKSREGVKASERQRKTLHRLIGDFVIRGESLRLNVNGGEWAIRIGGSHPETRNTYSGLSFRKVDLQPKTRF